MIDQSDIRLMWDSDSKMELYFLRFDPKHNNFITYMVKDCKNVTPSYVCDFLNTELEELRQYKVLMIEPNLGAGYPYDDKDAYFEWEQGEVTMRDCDVVIETYQDTSLPLSKAPCFLNT